MTDEEDHALRLCFATLREDIAQGELLSHERTEQLLAVAEELLQENVYLKAMLDVVGETPEFPQVLQGLWTS